MQAEKESPQPLMNNNNFLQVDKDVEEFHFKMI